MSKRTRSFKPRIQESAEQRCYEVTFEPMADQKYKLLPETVQQELDAIHAKLDSDPRSVLPRLLELKQQYPKTPLIFNYLSVAYGRVDLEQQKLAILENYRLHPEYLFARCHYAELCLEEGKPEKIPGIFDDAFDLKNLYPRRNRFHIGEYAAFASVLCKYYLAVGKREAAEELLQAFKHLAPQHPDVKRLETLLHPGWRQRMAGKLLGLLGK